jgi:hypothetical protein
LGGWSGGNGRAHPRIHTRPPRPALCATHSIIPIEPTHPPIPHTHTHPYIQALLVREFRGFGPLPLEAVDPLLRWQRQDADPSPTSTTSTSTSSTAPLLLLPDGTPDARLEGMAARVQAVKSAAKKRAAAAAATAAAAAAAAAPPPVPAPAPAPGPAPVAASVAPAPAAAELSEMEKRVLRLGKEVEAGKESGAWDAVLTALQALAREEMTVAALGSTRVGRVVNKLRKAEHQGVAALSKQLVEAWKGLVQQNES